LADLVAIFDLNYIKQHGEILSWLEANDFSSRSSVVVWLLKKK